jgi:hypothetical protein
MASRLSRRRPVVDPRPRILVVCEGEKTEPIYFEGLAREEEVRLLRVEVVPSGGVPKSVVERAVSMKRDALREARRQRDDNLAYDEVWCVFDVDEHPKLPEALDQARANEVQIVLSNPCFELWIVLHFEDQRGHIDRQRLQSVCRRHLPGYSKVVAYSDLKTRYPDAVQRAKALARWQEQQGRKNANPSTDAYLLTERLRSLGRSKLLREIETKHG